MLDFNFLIYIFVVFLGLSVGSFLNVVILRFDEIASIVKTRSHCPKCKKQIPWYDLIPFFSYIILGGRCRQCQKSISLQYPIVEATTALVFAAVYWHSGISLESLLIVLIFSFLIIIAAYDALHSEIPDILTYLAAFFALGLILYKVMIGLPIPGVYSSSVVAFSYSKLLSYLYALLIGGGFFAFLVIVSRQKWMGAGDAMLGGLMGLILGYPNILTGLFLAFVLGSLFSIVLMILKRKTLKDAVPFGPFLVAATFIAFFWGNNLINIYMMRFGI